MLIDHRVYKVRPGRLQAQLALYRDHGFAIQKRHCGDPLAFMITETGHINAYTHLWLYEDAAHRERARKALAADPEWIAYMKKSGEEGNIVSQENQLMIQVPFTPLLLGS